MLPLLGLLLLAGGAVMVLGARGEREATDQERQVLELVASGIPLERLEELGYGRIVGYEPGAGPGGWVGQGGEPPEPPVCYWDELLQDCGPNPCPPDFPECDPIPNCPPDQRWYGELGACYRPEDVPEEIPQCATDPPPEVFCEEWERPICVNGVWFCVTQPEPDPREGEACGREGYAGEIGQIDPGTSLLCDGTPGSLNGRWRPVRTGDPCPPGLKPTNMHCAYDTLYETRTGQPCDRPGYYYEAGALLLYCNSNGKLVGISEGEECSVGHPRFEGMYRSPGGELVCYKGEWRDTPSCAAAGTACALSFGLARFSCWAGFPANLNENRCETPLRP